VKIKSQRDFFAGLMFTIVGIAFAWGATTYSVGTGARMGPGYFPLMLGILLGVLGIIVIFTALTAYDVQRIQNGDLAIQTGSMEKAAVIGALHLYLDFVNLFLFMLRLFGGSRE